MNPATVPKLAIIHSSLKMYLKRNTRYTASEPSRESGSYTGDKFVLSAGVLPNTIYKLRKYLYYNVCERCRLLFQAILIDQDIRYI